MHQALYRKWRPATFDDVCGQNHITSVLRYEIQENKLSHAYLFCGSRGVGKTSCAKILAKAVNCLSPINGNPCGVCEACRAIEAGSATDVLEMDAASNNGVDNIRDIREEVMYAPATLKYRVYIVDEVHMLSPSAFNALLKTLEEPPSYVIFILATTEQHKLPATIISRCQRFEFRRISVSELAARLNDIAKEENIQLDPDAALAIARFAQGGMRDAISLLELCAGGGRAVTQEIVYDTIGTAGREDTMKMAACIAKKKYDSIFAEIADTVRSSKDLLVYMRDLLSLWRDMLVIKTLPDPSPYLDLTDREKKALAALAGAFTRETLLWQSGLLEAATIDMQRPGASARVTAELTLMKMCDEQLDSSNEALLSRISKLENAAFTGAPAVIPNIPEPEIKAPETPKKEQPKAPEIKTEKPTKKAFRQFAEIAERVAQTDMVASSFLRSAKATVEDNTLTVWLASDIAKNFADTADVTAAIAAAAASLSGKKYEIKYEIGQPDIKDDEPIEDEILDNAEEF
ncbi:MAG: DNA polymerase III subunit gamma/tau [Ruminococcaceae bacterium]|nr:DNA polymerase III subunit gamma/tau [Oscillospiraceae bacterium]